MFGDVGRLVRALIKIQPQFVTYCFVFFSNEDAPVVQTTHGKVRGILLKSLYDEQFYAFDGIPYAVPPLGTLRFKEPHDLKPWHGIRDCSKPLSKCLQVSTLTKEVEGSEDCLYLNISVKTVSLLN